MSQSSAAAAAAHRATHTTETSKHGGTTEPNAVQSPTRQV